MFLEQVKIGTLANIATVHMAPRVTRFFFFLTRWNPITSRVDSTSLYPVSIHFWTETTARRVARLNQGISFFCLVGVRLRSESIRHLCTLYRFICRLKKQHVG